MTPLRDLKALLLTVLIVLVVVLRHDRAEAGQTETLIVAGGCFWCVESDFESVPGVIGAVSGFTGGSLKNPTYKDVTNGGTGHYEAVRISFDSSVVSRDRLLAMFLRSVDPTDAGGQFCDRGDSYRTAIFVSNAGDKALARQAITDAQSELGRKIVTPVLDQRAFYPADAYHQDYYKGTKLILTRFGPKSQAAAYKLYRKGCGRDARVKQLWGRAAPFAGS